MASNAAAGIIAGGSILGNIASAGLNQVFGATNSKRAYHYQRNLMHLQNELNRSNQIWTYANGPQLSRQGLESAGYNPMLALSNLSSASPQTGLGSVSQAPSPDVDFVGGAVNAYQAFKLARQKNDAEVNATNASASLASEQAKTEQFRRQQIESQTLLNNIDHQLRSKDLSWYDRRALMQVKTGYMNAQANALSAQASASQAHTAKLGYQLNQEVQYWDKNLRERQNKWHADHKYQTDWQYGVGRWKNSLPTINLRRP